MTGKVAWGLRRRAMGLRSPPEPEEVWVNGCPGELLHGMK